MAGSEPVVNALVYAFETALAAVTGSSHWVDLSPAGAVLIGDPDEVPAGPDTVVIIGAPVIETDPMGASLDEQARVVTFGVLARTPSGDDTPRTKLITCNRLASEVDAALSSGARSLSVDRVINIALSWEQIQGGDFASSGMAAISGTVRATYTTQAGL